MLLYPTKKASTVLILLMIAIYKGMIFFRRELTAEVTFDFDKNFAFNFVL